jgi:DNA-binding beta-propeller fold protein YncE
MLLASVGLVVSTQAGSKPRLLLELPLECNTPDGCTLDPRGGIILSCPNFNNAGLVEQGILKEPAPARMMKITKDDKLVPWYSFKKEDLHPDTGGVGPMDCAFGPDGNLYVCDNQGPPADGKFNSRLLKITVKDGKAVSCEPVALGFGLSNAAAWKGDTIYVSDTILIPADKEKGTKLVSGVYAIPMKDWKDGPLTLQKPTADSADPRLIARYETSGRIGFGADGVVFDGEGNLYCSIFEDGILYKTSFDADGKAKPPVLFAKDPKMKSADGIDYCAKDKKIYVTDMLINGVQVVSMDGSVETLHQNGDTDGADGLLDEPCEVLVDGDRLVVVNMDWWFECEWLTNKKTDLPFTVSVIDLK